MPYQTYVNQLDIHTIQTLQTAIELGHWKDGKKLSFEQIESAMQAIMLWQAKNAPVSTHEPFKINTQGEMLLGKPQKKEVDEKKSSTHSSNKIWETSKEHLIFSSTE
jgi:uncharacterized protein YeaC (DUF1315 family)